MKKHLSIFLAVLFALLLPFTFISCGGEDPEPKIVFITDPPLSGPSFVDYWKDHDFGTGQWEIRSSYEGIDWNTWSQYKSANHAHTVNSDGRAEMFEALQAHYDEDYNIVTITDHVWKGSEGGRRYMDLVTRSWTQSTWTTNRNNFNSTMTTNVSHITNAQLNAFQNGTAVSGTRSNGIEGMLMIPNTAELALGGPGADEINVFFFKGNVPVAWGPAMLKGGLKAVQDDDAISFINHPGRATKAMGFPGGATDMDNPSNMSVNILRYANLYMEFSSENIVGMEIFNRRDQDSAHDRVLWDNVNKLTIPEGRFVWGYANDDSHSMSNIGLNFNVFVMPALTTSNFRNAMVKGQSYMVTYIAMNEGVNVDLRADPTASDNADFDTPAGTRPTIESITVDKENDTITVKSKHATKIQWVTSTAGTVTAQPTGGRVVRDQSPAPDAEGIITDTFDLNATHTGDPLGNTFIRVQAINSTGMAASQPIGIMKK